MSEQELIRLCREPKRKKKLFWTSEVYGFGPVIRKYGFFPRFLPLNIYLAHGITMFSEPAKHELENDAPVMLYFAPRLVEAFRNISSKPCYCLLSPNVYYRRSNDIVQDGNAKGTLAFLAHTTPLIEDKMDFTKYIAQLKSLPEAYQPITICLHYHDVNKNVFKPFFEQGMDVETVGHPYSEKFINRFYNLMKNFRYVTSNEIGSYTFYAVEMGIPFFLFGSEPILINHGDENIEKGRYTSFKETEQYKRVKELFSRPVDSVTPEQRAFVEEELGIFDSISRMKLSGVLYWAYLKYYKNKLSKRIKRRIGKWTSFVNASRN